MKNAITFVAAAIILAALLSSCKVYPPEYKRIDNFRFEQVDKEGLKLYGDVVIHNPNRIKVKLNDALFNVEMEGKHIATAGQMIPVKIKAKSDFSVPLNLVIKPDMSLTEGLKSIFKIIANREMELTIKGVVMVQAYGIKASVPIEQKEKVNLNKSK